MTANLSLLRLLSCTSLAASVREEVGERSTAAASSRALIPCTRVEGVYVHSGWSVSAAPRFSLVAFSLFSHKVVLSSARGKKAKKLFQNDYDKCVCVIFIFFSG